jgi:hypothetical protein
VAAARLSDSAHLLLTSVEYVRDSKDRIADTRLRLSGMRGVLARARETLESSADCLGRTRYTLGC